MGKSIPEIQRFEMKYQPEPMSGCWLWTGAIDYDGYGAFTSATFRNGKYVQVRAHRFAYETFRGVIPDGLVIDHLCRTPGCVNPDHLEPVTQAENHRRGLLSEVTTARNNAITHCPKRHIYDAENTIRNHVGARVCHICKLDSQRRNREKMRLVK